MPLNNQTPDPRFQRVLVAARNLVQLEVGTKGANVDWPALSTGLQKLREAMADLEGASTSTAPTTKVRPSSASPTPPKP